MLKMAYFAAIAAGSGVPLFTRTTGDLPALPYPKLASLNGAHFFASSLKAELRSCTNGGAKTVWKTFYDSVTLILVSTDDGSCDSHMTYLLELLFNAMVMVIGLQEFDCAPTIERLKQNMKWCLPLIDHILEQSELLCPLTRCVDVIACDDTTLLQLTLEGFTESAQSSYGCLLINHHVCVATQSWWELSTLETSLLSLFLSSLPPFTAKDIPVYLPRASNKIPHRILEGVELCILCDSAPSLVAVETTIESYWSGVFDALRGCTHTYPRCVPNSVTFDPAVLALCLVNMESGRCVSTFSPSCGTETRATLSAGFRGNVTTDKKREYFTRFYKTVVDQFLPSRTDPDQSGSLPPTLRMSLPHKTCHTYTCTTYFKAYGFLKDKFVFILLLTPSTATFALRKLAEGTFDLIIKSHLTAFNIIR